MSTRTAQNVGHIDHMAEEYEQARYSKPKGPRRKNWMRNRPCPCSSGRKFKKCCWSKFE